MRFGALHTEGDRGASFSCACLAQTGSHGQSGVARAPPFTEPAFQIKARCRAFSAGLVATTAGHRGLCLTGPRSQTLRTSQGQPRPGPRARACGSQWIQDAQRPPPQQQALPATRPRRQRLPPPRRPPTSA